ncbi:MAG: isoprenylcysteine carboxylmethyltransferase family protein [Desulfomonile tiedjei]|uniref:Isoprenylcysteine carboxylmethyltransferase family protein n=1 Tax=Desulfomonile tiedjei TaxID=2358 RepID=A0A9D6Z448_9BACT|nr:isoprenylcysteine carboxylmethyltransferase family protein [Desulfomonile tiedjei]
MSLSSDRVFVVVTRFLGRASLLAIFVFILMGSLNLMTLNMGEFAALALDTFLSIAFFLQHSGMVRKSFQRWSGSFVGEKYHGALFTIASSILLLLLVVLWQESSCTLYSAQGAYGVMLRSVFGLALLGFFWGARSLGRFDAFGLDPIINVTDSTKAKPKRLRIRGPYRWVRHPLYFFLLAMIWSCPHVTADRLLFNLLWTIWIVVGTILEESDLVALFGDEYQAYQNSVPMLIPTGIRPAAEV